MRYLTCFAIIEARSHLSEYTRRNTMNHVPTETEAEVLGTLRNGAQILAVFQAPHAGVVLAQWKTEYVTWVFPGSNTGATTSGNYFVYRKGMENERLQKYQQAVRDFQARVSYTLDNPRYL